MSCTWAVRGPIQRNVAIIGSASINTSPAELYRLLRYWSALPRAIDLVFTEGKTGICASVSRLFDVAYLPPNNAPWAGIEYVICIESPDRQEYAKRKAAVDYPNAECIMIIISL